MAELSDSRKLGFGFLRLPLRDEEDPASIDYEKVSEMADAFLARGFCYFDTAYNYHKEQSEAAIREAVVKRHPRDSFLLADKMPAFLVDKPDDFPRFFEEQLKRCAVSRFDFYLLHNLGSERYEKMKRLGAFEFMQSVKEQGIAGEIGFSFHDTADTLDRILTEHPEIDFVQLQLNYLDWESGSIQSRLCYETTRKHGKPITVMEPAKGGALARLEPEAEQILKEYDPDASAASWAIRYAASLDGVRMVLSGMSDMAQILDNTSYMKDFRALNEEEHSRIRRVRDILAASQAIQCTNCRYCMDECPMNINIPGYFSFYNSAMRQANFIDMLYTRVSHGHGAPWDCIGCRSCEGHCPQHLPITDYLKTISEYVKIHAL